MVRIYEWLFLARMAVRNLGYSVNRHDLESAHVGPTGFDRFLYLRSYLRCHSGQPIRGAECESAEDPLSGPYGEGEARC
jgi:hypothetical protein